MWDRQIPELAGTWRVVRFDLPGHGGAPAEPAHSVAELGDRLIATLDGLGVQRFGYAGCSIGGAIGADLALRHPHRVASLALVAASPRFGTADEFRQRGVIVRANGMDPMARSAPERWFTAGYAAAQPAIVEWAVQMVRTTDPACYIAACEALAAFDIRSRARPHHRPHARPGRRRGPGDRARRRAHSGRGHTRRRPRRGAGRVPPGAGRAARRRHRPPRTPLLHGLAGCARFDYGAHRDSRAARRARAGGADGSQRIPRARGSGRGNSSRRPSSRPRPRTRTSSA